jgi:hypothetical protein
MTPVQKFLQVLCVFYPSQGKPHVMNDTQIEVYLSALSRFTPEQLDRAGKQYMLTGKFFPALSELMELLEPKADLKDAAHMAWALFERTMRSVGSYRSVRFENGAVGETIRQVFGTWGAAGQFDTTSATWAIKRQTFLATFQRLAPQAIPPTTLGGQHRDAEVVTVPLMAGLPHVPALTSGQPSKEALSGPLSRDEAKGLLAAMAARRKEGKP